MKRVVVMIIAMLSGSACGAEAPSSGSEAPGLVSPAAMEISADRPGLIYRYSVGGEGLGTATTLDAVPEGARAAVLVYDTEAPPPPGWDHIADASKGFPFTTEPRQGFVYPVQVAVTGSGNTRVSPTRSNQVVMFSTQGCGYCRRARSFFAKKKVPFTEYDVETNPKASGKLSQLAKKAGVSAAQLQGVPILFINGKPIVGWDEGQVKKLLKI